MTSQLGPAEFGGFAALAGVWDCAGTVYFIWGITSDTRKFDDIDNNRAENFQCYMRP